MNSDLWSGLLILAVLAIVLLCPKISPCSGCVVAAEGNSSGDDDCRADCVAYQAYIKRCGRGN